MCLYHIHDWEYYEKYKKCDLNPSNGGVYLHKKCKRCGYTMRRDNLPNWDTFEFEHWDRVYDN